MTDILPLNLTSHLQEQGFYLRTPPITIVPVDPSGSGDDQTAIAIVDREEHQKGETWDPDFAVITMYRIHLIHTMASTTEFPETLSKLLGLHRVLTKSLINTGRSKKLYFLVELNGVGWGLHGALKDKIGSSNVLGITTTAGSKAKAFSKGTGLVMPRLPGLDHLRGIFELERIKAVPDMPGQDQLESQLHSFVWVRDGRPEGLEGAKDDIIMSLATACWVGEKVIPPVLRATGSRIPRRGRR